MILKLTFASLVNRHLGVSEPQWILLLCLSQTPSHHDVLHTFTSLSFYPTWSFKVSLTHSLARFKNLNLECSDAVKDHRRLHLDRLEGWACRKYITSKGYFWVILPNLRAFCCTAGMIHGLCREISSVEVSSVFFLPRRSLYDRDFSTSIFVWKLHLSVFNTLILFPNADT